MDKIRKEIEENYTNMIKLDDANNEIFTNMVVYLRTSKLDPLQQEEVINDLLEMFLRYQEEGKPIEEGIGLDYKGFCDNIISECDTRILSKNKVLEGVKIVVSIIVTLLGIDLVGYIVENKLKLGNVEVYNFTVVTLINILLIGILATGVVTYIGRNSFELSKNKKKLNTSSIIFGVVTIIIFLLLWLLKKSPLNTIVIFDVNIYLIAGSLLFYWIGRVVMVILNRQVT